MILRIQNLVEFSLYSESAFNFAGSPERLSGGSRAIVERIPSRIAVPLRSCHAIALVRTHHCRSVPCAPSFVVPQFVVGEFDGFIEICLGAEHLEEACAGMPNWSLYSVTDLSNWSYQFFNPAGGVSGQANSLHVCPGTQCFFSISGS